MSKSSGVDRMRSTDRVLERVADETRREILTILGDRTRPVSVEELATVLAARTEGRALVDVTREQRTSVSLELVHVDLPALAEADLVQWDRERDVVSATDHPAYDDGQLQELLAVDADDWDAVVAALADGHRRLALSVLEASGEPVDSRTLARRVAARATDHARSSVPDDDVEALASTLYHAHLPALQRAGLVSVDGDGVDYVGHEDLDDEFLSLELPTHCDPPEDFEPIDRARSHSS